MKSLLVGAVLFVVPGLAMAQSCCLTVGTASCAGNCGSVLYADSGTSFSTKHTWKMTSSGKLTLSDTGFFIVFTESDFLYHLKWHDKELSSDGSLGVVERRGVALATDRQEAGLPLE